VARLFMDSCGDHYDIAHITNKWDVVGNCSIITNEPGATGNCMHIVPQAFSYFDTFCRRNFPVPQNRLIAGFRYKCPVLPGSSITNGPQQPISAMWNGGILQCVLVLDASGRLSLWRDFAFTTQIGSYSIGALVRPNVWIYIEFDVTFSNTASGSMTLKANSQVVAGPIDFITTANTPGGANQFSIHGGITTAWAGSYFDDIYLNNEHDDGTHTCMGFDGDQQVGCYFPIGPGELTQWSIGGMSPAFSNWQSVNQAIPDDDLTFVSAGSANLIDL